MPLSKSARRALVPLGVFVTLSLSIIAQAALEIAGYPALAVLVAGGTILLLAISLLWYYLDVALALIER